MFQYVELPSDVAEELARHEVKEEEIVDMIRMLLAGKLRRLS
jgi:hypothetical protein